MTSNLGLFRAINSPATPSGLPHEEVTIAELLRDSPHQYETMMIGKWHLGLNDNSYFSLTISFYLFLSLHLSLSLSLSLSFSPSLSLSLSIFGFLLTRGHPFRCQCDGLSDPLAVGGGERYNSGCGSLWGYKCLWRWLWSESSLAYLFGKYVKSPASDSARSHSQTSPKWKPIPSKRPNGRDVPPSVCDDCSYQNGRFLPIFHGFDRHLSLSQTHIWLAGLFSLPFHF